MLTTRYVLSNKNVQPILNKIVEGVAPAKFNVEHLKSLGFGASNDRAIVPLLKDLSFLAPDGTPTPRYHQYRDGSQSKKVMAEALREAYGDVFLISERPAQSDRAAVEGLFKSKHNSNDLTAGRQAATFYTLLGMADLDAAAPATPPTVPEQVQRAPINDDDAEEDVEPDDRRRRVISTELHYTIQVHLPATKDIEVFNAIFRSLRENLLG